MPFLIYPTSQDFLLTVVASSCFGRGWRDVRVEPPARTRAPFSIPIVLGPIIHFRAIKDHQGPELNSILKLKSLPEVQQVFPKQPETHNSVF